MRESREFANAYTENVERSKPAVRETVEIVSDPTAGEVFKEGTAEFSESLDKIPRELLELFKSQFDSAPQSLVRGALRFVRTEADAQGDSDDTKTEDAETIGELEEEEGE